jgi:hypothetical protein
VIFFLLFMSNGAGSSVPTTSCDAVVAQTGDALCDGTVSQVGNSDACDGTVSQ